MISNVIEGHDNVVIVKAGSAEEQHKWLRNLTQHSKDHLRYGKKNGSNFFLKKKKKKKIGFSKLP